MGLMRRVELMGRKVMSGRGVLYYMFLQQHNTSHTTFMFSTKLLGDICRSKNQNLGQKK